MKVSEVGIAVHSLAAGVHLDHSRRCGMDFLNPFFPGCCSCGAKGPLLPEVPPAGVRADWYVRKAFDIQNVRTCGRRVFPVVEPLMG